MSESERLQLACEEAFYRLLAVDATEGLVLITGMFVGLTVETCRRAGQDTDGPICIDGGRMRDITIHAKKV